MRRRPVVRYHGGKHMLAPWIIANLPAHRVYVEPYGGGASVLMLKQRSYAEVYNDIDDEIVNVFRVLQDPVSATRLTELLTLTPFARLEFDLSYKPCRSRVEQARRTIIRAFMGFGSNAHNKKTGFRACSSRSGTTPAHDWANYPPHVATFCKRLQGVVIENRDALAIMRQHDSPETLHYVDPPYSHDTRGKGQQGNYRQEMRPEDHAVLLGYLRQVEGMVALSGYRNELYDVALGDWTRLDKAHHADGARDRTESLWLNKAATRMGMFAGVA